jgi:hypothetical protein
VNRLTRGTGVDLILDAVGSDLFEACIRSLRPGAKQVAIASAPNRRVQFDLVAFVHKRTQLIGASTIDMSGEEVARSLDELRPAFEEGQLQPPIFQTARRAPAKWTSSARIPRRRALPVGTSFGGLICRSIASTSGGPRTEDAHSQNIQTAAPPRHAIRLNLPPATTRNRRQVAANYQDKSA